MLQKLFKICCVVSSLNIAACGTGGPVVDVCISDPAHEQAVCRDKSGAPYVLPYSATDNYVMFSPRDAQALIEYVKACRAD